MAYFTDSMGDEFKKAIEEAMGELENPPKGAKKKRATNKSGTKGKK